MTSPPRRRPPPPSSPGRGGSPLEPLHPHYPHPDDLGLRAHLMRQRHWQRHQEEHPFPPPQAPLPPPQQAPGAGAEKPLLLRLRDQQPQHTPSPAALLVEDQFALSRFWSDWRAAEHRFLTGTASGGASSSAASYGVTAAAAGASRPGGSRRRRARAAEAEAEEDEEELEGDLEALLLEGPRRPPSPLSASVGAAGAKVVDGKDGDAKQPPHGHGDGSGVDESTAAGAGAAADAGNGTGNKSSAAEAALAARVRELEARLVETEALLGSDPGTVILALETELAQAKLALAHTEAEKDELEVLVCNLQQQQARGH